MILPAGHAVGQWTRRRKSEQSDAGEKTGRPVTPVRGMKNSGEQERVTRPAGNERVRNMNLSPHAGRVRRRVVRVSDTTSRLECPADLHLLDRGRRVPGSVLCSDTCIVDRSLICETLRCEHAVCWWSRTLCVRRQGGPSAVMSTRGMRPSSQPRI